MPKIDILGVHVDVVDAQDLQTAIIDSVRRRRKDVYAYVNVNAINIAKEDEQFRRFLNNSHMVYCDGEGVRVGARILGHRLPPRVVLTYWIWELCTLFEKEKFSVFFLGGTEQYVKEAVERVKTRFPAIVIGGSHHGFFEKDGSESDAVVAMIEQAKPNILIVGFGMPMQEHWIDQNMSRLCANVILPAGSMIDYTAGRKGLAPSWMADHGLEWLFRFFQEPGRLWKRYLIGNPAFMFRVLFEFILKGKR